MNETAAPAPERPVRRFDYQLPAMTTGVRQLTLAANPTDVFVVAGSNYTAGVVLRSITVDGVADAATEVDVLIQKSSNGGLPAGQFTTIAPANSDSFDGGAAATSYSLTANRTSNGNGIDGSRPLLAQRPMKYRAAGTDGRGVEFIFGRDGIKPPILRDLTEYFVVNLAGAAQPANAKINITVQLEAIRMVRAGFIGDSTTSNATDGLLNGGANRGGVGNAGVFNHQITAQNFGSNGYRLYDFIMGTGGVTYPLSVVLGRMLDIHVFCYLINDIRTGLCSLNQCVAMIDTYVYFTLNGAAANQIYVSPKATANALAALAWAGGTVTATTAAPHGWPVGATVNVQISGCTPAGYNGYYPITVTGANTFTYALAGDPGAATVQGTATYAMKAPAAMTACPDTIIILWGPNGFTADDAGDGPFRYLSATGNTVLSGLWTGKTLAEAAQAASQMLYGAYASFVGDPRGLIVVQKQDYQILPPDGAAPVYALPTFRAVANNADTPTNGTQATTMKNQIHPNARGQELSRRQIAPYVLAAADAVYDRLVL